MSCILTNRLAECLAAKKIKKSQLAHRFDLSRAHVTRLVRGDVQPSINLALRVAKYFDRPVDFIFQLVEHDQKPISRPCFGNGQEPTSTPKINKQNERQ